MNKAMGFFAAVLSLGLLVTAVDADAKRLGGSRNTGMQRQQSTQPATPPSNQPNAPANAAPAAGTAAAAAGPAAAAAAGKRSWMGPLAGVAAGLGLMALASHFGFGEAMANMMLIGLLIMAVLVVVGLVMRKRAAAGNTPAYAGAGAGGMARTGASPIGGTRIGSALGGVATAAGTAGNIPADFDAAAFARNAKAQFMALQSANDAGDLDRLRDYLTPEMFEAAREEVQSRGGATQATEVFGLDAQVVDVTEDADRYIVSVRFTGSVREQPGVEPQDLQEVWHLTKPRAGFGGWVVAGIQQV